MTSEERVAVIGPGAIGAAVARRLVQSGHEVTVWNRTESRTTDLLTAGARPAKSVPDVIGTATATIRYSGSRPAFERHRHGTAAGLTATAEPPTRL